ncbi:MAG: hypothetical protein AAF518_11750, partial [Spirochaetota bacterium]
FLFCLSVSGFEAETDTSNTKINLQNAMIIGCLVDYSVYYRCKNESSITPTFGGGVGHYDSAE